MEARKDSSTLCVVRGSATDFEGRAELTDNPQEQLEECKVLESVRQLLALGLLMREIKDLDIRQPMLEAISEYARLDDDADKAERASDAVEAALRVVTEEIRRLDMELEMLKMRRRALKRRAQILQKVAHSLQVSDDAH